MSSIKLRKLLTIVSILAITAIAFVSPASAAGPNYRFLNDTQPEYVLGSPLPWERHLVVVSVAYGEQKGDLDFRDISYPSFQDYTSGRIPFIIDTMIHVSHEGTNSYWPQLGVGGGSDWPVDDPYVTGLELAHDACQPRTWQCEVIVVSHSFADYETAPACHPDPRCYVESYNIARDMVDSGVVLHTLTVVPDSDIDGDTSLSRFMALLSGSSEWHNATGHAIMTTYSDWEFTFHLLAANLV